MTLHAVLAHAPYVVGLIIGALYVRRERRWAKQDRRK